MTIIKIIFAAIAAFCLFKADICGGIKYIATGIAAFIASLLLCFIDFIRG